MQQLTKINLYDNKVYILYQTDKWKTKSSRVCFGVFGLHSHAVEAARKNNLNNLADSEIEIVETTINRFAEI